MVHFFSERNKKEILLRCIGKHFSYFVYKDNDEGTERYYKYLL